MLRYPFVGNDWSKTVERAPDVGPPKSRSVGPPKLFKRYWGPLGIDPQLEFADIEEGTFTANPLESNRIWIAGRPMEDWLRGNVGSSRCCSVCGDSDCRTLEIQGTSFETIPETLIVKAGLLAAAELLDVSTRPVAR